MYGLPQEGGRLSLLSQGKSFAKVSPDLRKRPQRIRQPGSASSETALKVRVIPLERRGTGFALKRLYWGREQQTSYRMWQKEKES